MMENVYITMERSTMLLMGKLTINGPVQKLFVCLPEGNRWMKSEKKTIKS